MAVEAKVNYKQQDCCQSCDKPLGPTKCAELVTSQVSVSQMLNNPNTWSLQVKKCRKF